MDEGQGPEDDRKPRRPDGEARRGMRRIPSLFLALVAVLVLPHPAGSSASPVELAAKEFVLIPKDMAVQAGTVALIVKNQGAIEHDLVVESQRGQPVAQIAIIEPGETRRVDISLRPGTYKLYCNLPGHEDTGMVATLRVNP